jgi:hypothetical protein
MTFAVKPRVGLLTAAVELAVDAVATLVEPLGGGRMTVLGGMLRRSIEAVVDMISAPIRAALDAVALAVQPIFDAVASAIQAILDAIAAIGIVRSGRAAGRRRAARVVRVVRVVLREHGAAEREESDADP